MCQARRHKRYDDVTRGTPTPLSGSAFIKQGGHIRCNGQDSPPHQVGHDLTHKRLAEDFAQKARLRPSLRRPFNSGGIVRLVF